MILVDHCLSPNPVEFSIALTRSSPGGRQAAFRVISGIVHVLKSGGRWVDAPAAYGPRKTLYNRFVRWAAKGVWVDVFHALASAGGPPAQVLIDSSAVKAHRCASGGKGGSKIRRSAALAVDGPRRSTR